MRIIKVKARTDATRVRSEVKMASAVVATIGEIVCHTDIPEPPIRALLSRPPIALFF